jgi:hypothetical protein
MQILISLVSKFHNTPHTEEKMILKGLTLGEQVTWDEEIYPFILDDIIKKCGKGPFPVVGLRLHTKTARANKSLTEASYAVTVRLANGERHEFAGEWFRRAS